MSFAALVALLLLGAAMFPGPLLGIEDRYTRVLSRIAARVSEGALDDQTAFRRIRKAEVIEPRTSVRLFALGGFLLAVLSRAFKAETRMMPHFLIALLAIATVFLAVKGDNSAPARIGALVLGVLCVLAIL